MIVNKITFSDDVLLVNLIRLYIVLQISCTNVEISVLTAGTQARNGQQDHGKRFQPQDPR
jgi:hypothetical protein